MPAVLDFTLANVTIGSLVNNVFVNPFAYIVQNMITYNGQQYYGNWISNLTFQFYANSTNTIDEDTRVLITLYQYATIWTRATGNTNYSFEGNTAIYETIEPSLYASNISINISQSGGEIRNYILNVNWHKMRGVWVDRLTFKSYSDLNYHTIHTFNETTNTVLIEMFENGVLFSTNTKPYTGNLTAGTTISQNVNSDNVSLNIGRYDYYGKLNSVALIRDEVVNWNHLFIYGAWLDNYTYKFYTSSIDFMKFEFNSSNNMVVATRTDGSLYENLYYQGNLPGTASVTPICFNKGTKILCLINDLKEEYVAVEKLKPGDVVKSYKHGYRRIVMVHESFLINDPRSWNNCCLLYTSPSPRDRQKSRMPSSA